MVSSSSRWGECHNPTGEDNTIRFPQTRTGVEQVFVDHFTRARGRRTETPETLPQGPGAEDTCWRS